MKLSAPIYHLKRKAKLLARKDGLPLHEALGRIAAGEGFSSWGLLIANAPPTGSSAGMFARLAPGDLVLLAARPGHGKTLMSLELAVEAMRSGHQSMFFTLEYTPENLAGRFRALGVNMAQFEDLFAFDDSDAISADHIIERLKQAPRGTLVVVDYLQLLDQRRENPPLMVQVGALKSFAQEKGLIIVFISQIDRSYDSSKKPWPDLADVRLPNPLDLSLFSKTCFLHNGEARFRAGDQRLA